LTIPVSGRDGGWLRGPSLAGIHIEMRGPDEARTAIHFMAESKRPDLSEE
jgi:hypothetical protein